MLALCLVLQGLTWSVERARGRAHHHVDATEHGPQHLADLDGHHYAPELAQLAHNDDDRHAGVGHHDHDATTFGVVDVAEDGGASALNPHPTLARSAHDLDGLLVPRFDVPDEADVAASWAGDGTPPFESHIGSPLLRPPRA